jgi:hypothetical protein
MAKGYPVNTPPMKAHIMMIVTVPGLTSIIRLVLYQKIDITKYCGATLKSKENYTYKYYGSKGAKRWIPVTLSQHLPYSPGS